MRNALTFAALSAALLFASQAFAQLQVPSAPMLPSGGASGGASYTAGSGLTLTGTAFSLGDGVGISYTSPGQLSLLGGTVTTNNVALSITQTWNASGTTFDAPLLVNVTRTAAGNNSQSVDFQVGGASVFGIVPVYPAVFIHNTDPMYFNNDGTFGGTRILALHGANSSSNPTIFLGSAAAIGWSGSTDAPAGSADTLLTRHAPAYLQFGFTDAAAPIAQTVGVQNVVGGTSNTASPNRTEIASLPTGSGLPGDTIFQTGFQGVSATATITFSDSAAGANTCTVNWTSNGLSANQAFTFSGGTAPTGGTAGTTYYVLTPGTNSFTCSATPGGTILAITTNGSGTITGQTATAQEPPITALTIKGGTQQVNFSQPFQTAASSTGAGTETFTNSPCTGLTTEQWVPVKISGQTGTWFVPACQ